jgi:hypothetical protein
MCTSRKEATPLVVDMLDIEVPVTTPAGVGDAASVVDTVQYLCAQEEEVKGGWTKAS